MSLEHSHLTNSDPDFKYISKNSSFLLPMVLLVLVLSKYSAFKTLMVHSFVEESGNFPQSIATKYSYFRCWLEWSVQWDFSFLYCLSPYSQCLHHLSSLLTISSKFTSTNLIKGEKILLHVLVANMSFQKILHDFILPERLSNRFPFCL